MAKKASSRLAGALAIVGGAGLISFVIAFGYSILTTGPLTISIHAEYWIGLFFATIARWIAK